MTTPRPTTAVTEIPPADSAAAQLHFGGALRYETDCWDVHASSSGGQADFVLLDVRSPDAYREGHVAGALSVPHRKIVEGYMAKWPKETVFVVYCAGPHCNGAHRAAARLAGLNRPVKLMLGGITGWLDEGFTLVRGETPEGSIVSEMKPSSDNKSRYDTRLDIKYQPLEHIDEKAFTDAVTHPWFNQTLCAVNESVVRIGVVQGEYHWHKHDKDDEFFYVVEGELHIDLRERSISLGARQGVVIPRGVEHRPRAPGRTVMLMVETKAIVPTGD